MKNNKGFSLVELIIVIAIMAILVGVMAPQLIKYIEKTNVSSDAQTCDSIRSAITTAMLDPEVVNSTGANIPGDGTHTSLTDGTFRKAVDEILGYPTNVDPLGQAKFKSHVSGGAVASGLTVKISNGNSVSVYLTDSDPTGKKNSGATTDVIGAGPELP